MTQEVTKDFRNLVNDYSKVYAFRQKGITKIERPVFIPSIDLNRFERRGCRVEFKKIADNDYFLFNKDEIIRVDLDILALTQDYYFKLAKETRKIKNEMRLNELIEEYGEEKGKRYHSAKRIKAYTPHQATTFQLNILSNNYLEAWKIFRANLEELNQKLLDLELETTDSNNTYSKGQHTSYGDCNLNGVLFDSHGVNIKLQNGNPVTFTESDLLKDSLDKVFNVYGDLSPVFREYGLKISFSGDKKMHARKANGIFFPHFRAIGTSQFNTVSTLAHEIAHFMDFYTAKQSNVKRTFSSDEDGSTARKIAGIFRKNMNEITNSKYMNRTCECFARALQQFVDSSKSTEPNYCKDDAFRNEVAPLVESFLQDFSEIVKSVEAEEKPIENKLEIAASASKKKNNVKPVDIEQLNLF